MTTKDERPDDAAELRRQAGESESRARAMLQAIPDLMFRVDSQGVFLDYKADISDLYDQSEPTIIGRRNRDIAPPGFADLIDRQIRAALETGLLQTYEFQLPIPGRGIRDYEARMIASGPDEVTAIVRDITDRKRVEEALQESEQRFRAIASHTPDHILIQDRDLRYELVINPQLGLTEADMLGKTDRDFLAPEDAERVTAVKREVLATGKPLHFETSLQNLKGETEFFDGSYIPKFDSTGKADGLIGYFRNVTERRRGEERLAQIMAALESTSEAIGISDAQGHHFYQNKASSELFEYATAAELEAAGGGPAVVKDPKVATEMFDNIMHGRSWVGELEMVTKSGHVFPAFERADAVLDEAGKVIGLIGVITDITDLKRAEEERAKLEEQLQQSQKMESVGRLAGGVAHDFNNMLQAILGHAALALRQVSPDQPLYEDLMEIKKASQRSANLTQQLLAFARKQTVAPEVLDLNETVGDTLKMLQRLIGEDIRLRWQPGFELWQVKVDPSQIDQILTNLCVNARDAIADVGKITVEIRNITFDEDYCSNHPDLTPGDYVMLVVSDDGCGMDKETQKHIFEPFFTTKEVGKGTGLGLATVYGAIKQNNGFINVYSEPGQGTTFTIYLPRYIQKTAQTAQIETPQEEALGGQETILLVEDELVILNLTTRMLKGMGYTVVQAITPGEAIRLAREHAGEIHALLTDVVMPEMNGRDLAKNLLSLYPSLKRIFMSGYTADVIAHHGVLEEGVHFIQKPFSGEDLAAKIREALDRE